MPKPEEIDYNSEGEGHVFGEVQPGDKCPDVVVTHRKAQVC